MQLGWWCWAGMESSVWLTSNLRFIINLGARCAQGQATGRPGTGLGLRGCGARAGRRAAVEGRAAPRQTMEESPVAGARRFVMLPNGGHRQK